MSVNSRHAKRVASRQTKRKSFAPVPQIRKPLGMVLPLTDEEIAALATITQEDIDRAMQTIDPELASLLNAVPMGKRKTNAQSQRAI
jgi:hypothetical protein